MHSRAQLNPFFFEAEFSRMNQIHNLHPYFPKIHFNIMFRPGPPSCFDLPFRPCNENSVSAFHLLHSCYMPRTSNSPLFDYRNKISWIVQILSFIFTRISSVTPFFLSPSILFRTLFSGTLNLCCYLDARGQLSRQYKTSDIFITQSSLSHNILNCVVGIIPRI